MPNGGIVNGRMMMDVSANSVCINPSLGMFQCGNSFSHPGSRLVTVLRSMLFDR